MPRQDALPASVCEAELALARQCLDRRSPHGRSSSSRAPARRGTSTCATSHHSTSASQPLWQQVASKFGFAVRRDARYLQWKYVKPPHLRYEILSIEREGALLGYAVYRHADDARGQVTALVDFLADPDDPQTFASLLKAVEWDARKAGSDKIRVFAMNAAFRRQMRALSYSQVPSTIEFVAKVNAVPVGPDYYADTSRWHVTFGDSDQDR